MQRGVEEKEEVGRFEGKGRLVGLGCRVPFHCESERSHDWGLEDGFRERGVSAKSASGSCEGH
jgi:hypothetical protein